MRRVGPALAALAVVAALWRPVQAGIDSLWTDDATLVKQLAELMEINQELNLISDGILVTADATSDMLRIAGQARATFDEIQSYSPETFWRDLKADAYDHYPGFEYLETDKQLVHWKDSRARSPVKTYDLIGAVFADLTEPLKEQERKGDLDTKEMRLRKFEAAGALSLAGSAEEWTRTHDTYAQRLSEQAERLDAGDPAALLSAKSTLLVAAQNSHIIRLLARKVRLDGVENALAYGRRVRALNQVEQDKKSLSATFGKDSRDAQRTHESYLIPFGSLWKDR